MNTDKFASLYYPKQFDKLLFEIELMIFFIRGTRLYLDLHPGGRGTACGGRSLRLGYSWITKNYDGYT